MVADTVLLSTEANSTLDVSTCALSTIYTYTVPEKREVSVAVARTVIVADVPEATFAVTVAGENVSAAPPSLPPPPPPQAAKATTKKSAHRAPAIERIDSSLTPSLFRSAPYERARPDFVVASAVGTMK